MNNSIVVNIDKARMKKTAEEYLDASQILFINEKIAPAMSLAAFSAEIYLKYVIYVENNVIETGHNLVKLYKKIDKSTQGKLDKLLIKTNHKYKNIVIEWNMIKFIEILDKYKNEFTIYRYAYEVDNRGIIDFGLLFSVIETLRVYCELQ